MDFAIVEVIIVITWPDPISTILSPSLGCVEIFIYTENNKLDKEYKNIEQSVSKKCVCQFETASGMESLDQCVRN